MFPYVPPIGLLAALALACVAYLFERRDGHIPNALTLPAILVGLLFGVIDGQWTDHVASFVMIAVPAVAVFRKGFRGAGGAKLTAAAGAFAGLPAALFLGGAFGVIGGGLYAWTRVKPPGPIGVRVPGSLLLLGASIAAIAVDFGMRVVKH